MLAVLGLPQRRVLPPFGLLALAACLACSSQPKPEKTVPYGVIVRNTDGNELRLYADGKPVPSSGAGWRVTGPYPDGKQPATVPVITVEKLFPCGWRKVASEQQNPLPQEFEAFNRTAASPLIQVTLVEEKHLVNFHVDNRGGAPAVLALGQQKRRLLPGGHADNGRDYQLVSFDLPDCPDGASVRWDDREIGILALEGLTPDLLVDPTGKRCYVFRELNYTTAEGRRQFAGLPLSGPVTTRLAPRHLHRLPARLSYFLERAPDRIGTNWPSGEVRGELHDSPCR